MMTPQRIAALKAMKEIAKGEKLFRPSSIARSIKCRGSIWAGLRAPKDTRPKPEARQGTAAHKIAERVLKDERSLTEWAGRKIIIGDGGPDIVCDEEMVDALDLYLEEVYSRRFKGVNLLVEQHLSLSLLDESDPLLAENAGTADVVLVDPKARKLTIIDLKYGKGVMVAGDSPQLKNYALMGSLAFHTAGGWEEIETLVVQPRAYSEAQRVKPVLHDPNALMMDFVGELVEAMEGALDVDAPLVPGDHCTFCAAAATCPALQDRAMHIAQSAIAKAPLFTASSNLPALPTNILNGVGTYLPHIAEDPANVILPPPTQLDPGDIATILERESMWDTWISAVKHRAAQMIEAGITIPGWKMVLRTGNRQWKEPDKVEMYLAEIGMTEGQMYAAPKLKSPAQMEKILPRGKKDIIAALTERPLGAPTLVKASDAREGKASRVTALSAEDLS